VSGIAEEYMKHRITWCSKIFDTTQEYEHTLAMAEVKSQQSKIGRICGIKKGVFYTILGVVLAVAIGLGVGLGVGLTRDDGDRR
jgi:hypothetical protein